MIDSYTTNPQLFDRCINLINQSFPGCKEFALNGIKYNAPWDKISTPFVIEKNDQIIAHAGVWPITFVLNGKEHHSAAIHGVCVDIHERGKGYFQQLMREVMLYLDDNFESSILFTTRPYLYKNYPYKIMLPEYDFILNNIQSPDNFFPKTSDLRILSLDKKEDLDLLHKMLNSCEPLSNQLSIIQQSGQALFILNTMKQNIHYSDKLNALIVYEIVNKVLYLKEIISVIKPQLSDVLWSIMAYEKTAFDRIILQFCPDKFLEEGAYSAILARPKCCIMTSDNFLFNGIYFRYPELYQC